MAQLFIDPITTVTNTENTELNITPLLHCNYVKEE